MKVIFCTDGIFPHVIGGIQRHSRLLIEELASSYEIELIVVHPHKGISVFPHLKNVTEIGLDSPPGRQYYVFELYLYSREVLKIIDSYPDAIVYSQGLPVWAGIRRIGYKLIVNPHGIESYQVSGTVDKIKTRLLRIAFQSVFNHAAFVVSLGGRLTDILISQAKVPQNKIRVIHNAANVPAVDEELLKKKKRHAPIKFLFVSRFISNKGMAQLLMATQKLNAAGKEKEFSVEMVGDGPLFHHFKNMFPLPNMKFHGFVEEEEFPEIFHNNDVFILPTEFDGMPTVAIEAMAFGLPAIVTDVGAVREMVGPDNGILMEESTVENTQEAMLAFMKMSDMEYSEKSAMSVAKFREKLNWKSVAEQYMQLFRELSKELS